MMPKRKPIVRLTDEQRALAETCVRLAYGEGFREARRRDLPRRLRIEASEAVGLAFLGLTQAAQAYKPERGYAFSTYATCAIRMEMSKERVRRNSQKRQHPKLLPLYRRNLEPLDIPAPPSHDVETSDAAERLRRAMTQLPERERSVVCLWSEGHTFDEIGKQIGLSRQRAHQIHQAGIAMLADQMCPEKVKSA